MSAAGTVEPPLDDIRTIMGNIGDEEHEARAKLRSLRNAASALVSRSQSPTAKQLAWVVIEYLAELLYAPANEAQLAELKQFCTRVMLVACQAENIETIGLGCLPSAGGDR